MSPATKSRGSTSRNSSHSEGARTENLFEVITGLYLIAWRRAASMVVLMLKAGVTLEFSMLGTRMALDFQLFVVITSRRPRSPLN